MNILILNWRDPKHPLAGGAEISLLFHANYWKKKGANITWFSSEFKNSKKTEVIDDITYIRRGSHYTFFLKFFLYYMTHHTDCDIVVDSFHFIPFFSPLFMRNKRTVALINEVAGKIWFKNINYLLALLGFFLEPFFIRLYRKKQFITCSESTSDDLVGLGIKKILINVIHNGILRTTAQIDPKKNSKPVLIFLGRISNDKGIEDAIKAVAMLKEQSIDTQLWIVGKKESEKYNAKIALLIEKMGVKDRCKIFGFVSEQEKFKLLSKAWVLVHPSIKEGWGLNVIEANSVGTPAVGYNVAGLKDSIVNGKTGLLVNSDVISLADGLRSMINDKEKYDHISKRAIEWSKNFTWEKAGEQSFAVIKKAYGRS